MKKILFATAYGSSSKNNWQYTLELAHHFEATITIMHVYEDASPLLLSNTNTLQDSMVDNIDLFNIRREEEEEKRLKNFVALQTPEQFRAVSMQLLVIAGDEASAILEEEKNKKYDLLILGASTSHRISQALFGSVASKVLNHSRTAVFLVPPMASYQGIRKMVFVTNFQPADLDTIHHLMEWTKKFNAKLQLLHVYPRASAGQEALEKMETLLKPFHSENKKGMLTFELLAGDSFDMIKEYMKIEDSDVLVFSRQKKGFFANLFEQNIADKLSLDSIVPVLVFKEKVSVGASKE